MTGKAIVVASWSTLAVFTIVAALNAVGLRALYDTVTVVSVVLFLASIAVWIYAFGLALVRSARGDDIAVGSWVFLTPSAPAEVRRHLLGATAASIVVAAATAWVNPFAVLVPMFPLGCAALWGARHGVYPPRRERPVARGARPVRTSGAAPKGVSQRRSQGR